MDNREPLRMPPRYEIKARAKQRLKERYGTCIGVVLLSTLITLVISALFPVFTGASILDPEVYMQSGSNFYIGVNFSTSNVLITLLGVFLVSLLTSAISVEECYFFLRVYQGQDVSMGEFLSGLLVDVGKKIGCMLWQTLFVFLWSLPGMAVFLALFILLGSAGGVASVLVWLDYVLIFWIAAFIPAIVKTYSYSMMPYILRDRPEVTVRQSMKLSIAMTKGHRWKLFVLGLSFLLWVWLGMVTLGIVLVLFVIPYINTATAGFYHELKGGSPERTIATEKEF